MDKKNEKFYAMISIGLFAAIIGIIIFVIIPKFSKATTEKMIDKIDFSNSAWIEQFVDKSVGIFGNDFYQSTAFSYTPISDKMVVTYASQKSIEEVRNYYLSLPGAKQFGRNDETSLNITAEINGQTLEVYNFYSEIAQVFELKLVLNKTNADKVISQLEKAFPEDELKKIPEIKDILSSDLYGGYVRYQYDNLDEFAYPNIPIFSRAYMYTGTEEDFLRVIKALSEAYPVNTYNKTQNIYY